MRLVCKGKGEIGRKVVGVGKRKMGKLKKVLISER